MFVEDMVLLKSLWGLDDEPEEESLAAIAKRNRAMNGPYATSAWERAAMLDKLESGQDPFADVAPVATAVAKLFNQEENGGTELTLKKVLLRMGDDDLLRAHAEYGGDA